ILAAFLLDDLTQRGIHVFRHSTGISTYEKMRAILEPSPDFNRVFHHAVLHVNLMGLIPRPGTIESRENAIALELIEILFVGVVAFLSSRSEEKPVFSFRAECLSFLQISTKRRDTGARSDHDD